VRAAAVRWRDDVHHLLVSLGMAVAGYGVLVLVVASAGVSLLGGVGLPLSAPATGLARQLTDRQRARSGLEPSWPWPDGSAASATAAEPFGGVRATVSRPVTSRELLWLASPLQAALALFEIDLCLTAAVGVLMPLLHLLTPRLAVDYLGVVVVDIPTSLTTVANGLLVGAGALVAPRWLLRAERWQARWLLAPTATARLTARVEGLARTRTEALDTSAVELRRIERDLHDGAQARLVSLSMNLGMAQDLMATDPTRATALLAAAKAQARKATGELRALVRGIQPPLLADRGLEGALRALALDSPVRVDLEIRLERRLSPPVESAVYFAVLEALTNAVKHSGATSIRLVLVDRGDRLVVRVTDDGCGGADPGLGTGLRGIERRIAVFDGSVRVQSPRGGPTILEVQLPCGC